MEPGNGKGKMWTTNEKVALCLVLQLVAQRADKGAYLSKDDLSDKIKADFDGSAPKSPQQG